MSENSVRCAVCGSAVNGEGSGYLLSAPTGQNRIAILRWNSALSEAANVRAACAPEHALEIVAHWMVSGRLDLEFTAVTPPSPAPHASLAAAPASVNYRPISELVINRDSVRELLAHDPEALASVLDSLLEALHRDCPPVPPQRIAPHRAVTRQVSVA